jgi:hypothetical protein
MTRNPASTGPSDSLVIRLAKSSFYNSKQLLSMSEFANKDGETLVYLLRDRMGIVNERSAGQYFAQWYMFDGLVMESNTDYFLFVKAEYDLDATGPTTE